MVTPVSEISRVFMNSSPERILNQYIKMMKVYMIIINQELRLKLIILINSISTIKSISNVKLTKIVIGIFQKSCLDNIRQST